MRAVNLSEDLDKFLGKPQWLRTPSRCFNRFDRVAALRIIQEESPEALGVENRRDLREFQILERLQREARSE